MEKVRKQKAKRQKKQQKGKHQGSLVFTYQCRGKQMGWQGDFRQ
jgi:hypothetical protein